jgi:hypothetical protein
MTENLLLAVLGSTAGALIGYSAAKLVLSLSDPPPGMHVTADWRVVLAGFALALFSAAVFGLAPAMQAVRRETSRGERGRPSRARKILVTVQVAASCFLLIFASLLARSTGRQLDIQLRYDFERLITLDPQLYAHNLHGPAALQKLDELAARIQQVPGVTGVAYSVSPPYSERLNVDMTPGLPRLTYNEVSVPYFDLMNLPLVRGRLFSQSEPDVAVVSESAARAIWPGQDPLGKTLYASRFTPMGQGKTLVNGRQKRTVIGIVKDTSRNEVPSHPKSTRRSQTPILPRRCLLSIPQPTRRECW